MIDLYTGTPGSGKSLHCAERIRAYIHYLKSPVIANFEVKAGICKPRGYGSFFYVPNKYISPDFFYDFSEVYRKRKKLHRLQEDSILVIIDEAQIIFNARTWSKPERMGWISFFSQHRKLGYHIILVCQYNEMIDKQIRCLIEYEYLHRKVKNIGLWGRILSMISFGDLHICNIYHVATNLLTSHYFFKGNSILYSMYDSYTKFDEFSSEGMRSVASEENSSGFEKA